MTRCESAANLLETCASLDIELERSGEARTDLIQVACMEQQHWLWACHAANFPHGALGSRQVRWVPGLGDAGTDNARSSKSRVLDKGSKGGKTTDLRNQLSGLSRLVLIWKQY